MKALILSGLIVIGLAAAGSCERGRSAPQGRTKPSALVGAGCEITAPADGSSGASPLQISVICNALPGQNIIAVQTYVDDVFTAENPTTGNSVSTVVSTPAPGGLHRFIAMGWDDSAPQNTYLSQTINVTIGGHDPIFAGAGDIACGINGSGAQSSPSCFEAQTANLIRGWAPDFVWAAGDTQYDTGNLSDYNDVSFGWAGTWGVFNSILRPAVGNHEYANCAGGCFDNSVPQGYFDYFSGQGVPVGQASTDLYYSYDIPTTAAPWHVIVLDVGKCWVQPGQAQDEFWCFGYSGSCNLANGAQTGDCTCPAPGPNDSRQNSWLCNDLATHKKQAFGGPYAGIIAVWHQPRFADVTSGDNWDVTPIWNMLYNYKTDVVLNGHAHFYERFDPTGHISNNAADTVPDPNGIREWVVGTGGIGLNTSFNVTHATSVVASQKQVFGALRMTLHPASYDAEFIDINGVSQDAVFGIPVH